MFQNIMWLEASSCSKTQVVAMWLEAFFMFQNIMWLEASSCSKTLVVAMWLEASFMFQNTGSCYVVGRHLSCSKTLHCFVSISGYCRLAKEV